ncbi:MAG: hypothetical protein Q9225_007835 [Loekoesia sp. 1 TL-2023]
MQPIKLTTLKGKIDPERIEVLGIYASGGYTSYTAQSGSRIKALAAVSAACLGRMTSNGDVHRENKENLEDIAGMLQAAGQRRTSIANGEHPETPWMFDAANVPAYADPFFKDVSTYYGTKLVHHERSNQRVPPVGYDLMAPYDSFNFQHLISPGPLLMIAGSKAQNLHYSETAARTAKDPKEFFIVEGKNHFDMYDDLSETGPKLVQFFGGRGVVVLLAFLPTTSQRYYERHVQHRGHLPARQLNQYLAQRVANPLRLGKDPHNYTVLDNPTVFELRATLAKRAVDFHSYVCKGNRVLQMIAQDPPSTRIWTRQDLDNGWDLSQGQRKASSPLLPALQALGIPHTENDIHPISADQFKRFTDSKGRPNNEQTNGWYNNQYLPSGHTIIALTNRSPRLEVGPNNPIPPLNRWSDVAWLLWTLTPGNKDNPSQISKLRYVIRDNVGNEITREIIERIEGVEPDTLDLPWPGHTYDMRTDGGKALLGTPNGIGVAYLIKDHSDVLGRRIPSVRIFSANNEGPGWRREKRDTNGSSFSSRETDSESDENEPAKRGSSSSEPESSEGYFKWNYYLVWELRYLVEGYGDSTTLMTGTRTTSSMMAETKKLTTASGR